MKSQELSGMGCLKIFLVKDKNLKGGWIPPPPPSRLGLRTNLDPDFLGHTLLRPGFIGFELTKTRLYWIYPGSDPVLDLSLLYVVSILCILEYFDIRYDKYSQ